MLKYFVCFLIILSGIGGILLSSSPLWAFALVIMGSLIAAALYLIGEYRYDKLHKNYDDLARLIARSGLSNIYSDRLKARLQAEDPSKISKKELLKALEIDPNDVFALSMLAILCSLDISFKKLILKRKTDSREIKFTEDIIDRGISSYPELSVFYQAKGILVDAQGDHDKARELFIYSGSISSTPDWRLLVATSWGMSKNYKEGFNELQQAKMEGAQGWLFDLYYGRACNSIGLYEEAVGYLERAYREHGKNIDVMIALSDCYYYSGYFRKAGKITLLESIQYLFFGSTIITLKKLLCGLFIYTLGYLLDTSKFIWTYTKKQDFLKKIHWRVLPPFEPEFTLSLQEMKKKHFAFARILLKRILSLDENDWRIWANLAVSLANLGNQNDALIACNKAIALNPEEDALKWNLEQIKNGAMSGNVHSIESARQKC